MHDHGETVVETKNGKIEGDFRDGVYVFKGIPYAVPPLEDLRWLPPQPVLPWDGVRRAKDFGPNAPQNLLPGEPIESLRMEGPQDEDCLYLNIWSYNYLFTWKSPIAGGVLGACHALEIGFVFGKHDETFCGPGPDADRLSRNIQDAWISFARTGNPSCESIGTWEPYGDRRVTMMLDRTCRLQEAPYEGERSAWDQFSLVFTKPI